MKVNQLQQMFFLALPTLDKALQSRTCRRHKLNRTDLIYLIAANIFFDGERFSTKSLRKELEVWGYTYSLRNLQIRFNNLVRCGYFEQVCPDSYITPNVKMPALYRVTTTGSYVIRDFTAKLKEAVRRLERT